MSEKKQNTVASISSSNSTPSSCFKCGAQCTIRAFLTDIFTQCFNIISTFHHKFHHEYENPFNNLLSSSLAGISTCLMPILLGIFSVDWIALSSRFYEANATVLLPTLIYFHLFIDEFITFIKILKANNFKQNKCLKQFQFHRLSESFLRYTTGL